MRYKSRQKALLNFWNMFSCSVSLCVDTWSDGKFPARPGFGWPNWTGGLLRIKGWVDGGTDVSGERRMENRSYIQAASTAWIRPAQIPLGSEHLIRHL